MTTTTANLGLFKYNTTDDASTVFNINRALNDNWDSIDSWANGVNSLLGTFSQSFATASGSSGKKVFQDILTELDKKLEAEVSLSENGYIKFNNNGFLIQWGHRDGVATKNTTIYYPQTFTTIAIPVSCRQVGSSNSSASILVSSFGTSYFYVRNNGSGETGCVWHAVGI